MASPFVRLDCEGHVATITLARPEKLNALDLDMLEALRGAAEEIDANHDLRVAILVGEGKAFSAGGDIKAWGGMGPEAFGRDWVRHGHRIFDCLASLRVPLIAALNGHAFGGGLELAGTADFRIAEEGIRIGLPETGLGMVPGWSGTQRLVKRFGAQAVRRMVLGGEMFNAGDARQLGLVDHVVAAGGALEAARDYARTIVARGPVAQEVAKLMIASANDEDAGAAMETVASILVAKTGDLTEGLDAFRGKRPAHFKGAW